MAPAYPPNWNISPGPTQYGPGAQHIGGSRLYPGSNGVSKNTSPSIPPPLDGLTAGVKEAYSTRKLLTAYAGSAIRVQRDSDSTQIDIGFVSNVLDTATLATFCSGTTGRVVMWYGQINGNTLILGTAPVIYQSGAVTTINGKPAILFTSASSQFLKNIGLSANPVNTLYQNFVVSLGTGGGMAISGPAVTAGFELQTAGGSAISMNAAQTANLANSTSTVPANSGSILENQYNSTSGAYSFWINRASAGTGTVTHTFTASNLQVGSANSTDFVNGLMGEYISYDLVGGIPSASQTAIVANQKAYWGTP